MSIFRAGSLKLVMLGVFVPWKLANTIIFFAQERGSEHLPADLGVLTLYVPLSATLVFSPLI